MTPDQKSPETTDTSFPLASRLNFSDTFPHLKRAPVVEAVIDFRAPASLSYDEAGLRTKLAEQLVDYPKVNGRRLVENTFTAAPGKSPEATARDLGFIGLEFRSADARQVLQMFKDGFLFSRLQPYENWEVFVSEAMRLWKIHCQAYAPEEIKRVGVRFVNQMQFPLPARIADYLAAAPVPTPNFVLPSLATFFHQELRPVPETPYLVNVIKTMQPVEHGGRHFTLILDIDVSMTDTLRPNDPDLLGHLARMRWLKNKAFFANLTQKSVDTYI